MKVTPKSLDFPLAMSDPNRGAGLHASDIYGSFFKQLQPEKYDKADNPVLKDLLFAIGLAWEQYLEKVLIANGELCARPGELVSPEGVLYSPDLLVVNGHDRIGEIKATHQSSRDCVPGHDKFEKYLCQVKAYCYWSGIPRARFYVLYLHGDWRRGDDGKLMDFKMWDVDFTSRELKDNHKMLMNHAEAEGLWDATKTA